MSGAFRSSMGHFNMKPGLSGAGVSSEAAGEDKAESPLEAPYWMRHLV